MNQRIFQGYEDIVLNNIRAFALRLDRAERIGQS